MSRVPSWTALRATGLFLHLELHDLGESFSMPIAGFHVQHIARARRVAEFGADLLLGLDSIGSGAVLRGGYALGVHGPHAAQGSGSRGFIVPLLGYRVALRPVTKASDGYGPHNETHSGQLGVAYDLFFGSMTAVTLRLFTAFEYAFVSRKRPNDLAWEYTVQEPMQTSIQGGISIGVAFGSRN